MAIEITEYRSLDRNNSLKGFFSVRMTTIGLEIKGVAYHQKPDGKRWIQLPTKPYEKPDGTTAYAPVVEFFDTAKGKLFQKLTLEALDKYRQSTPPEGRNVF